MRTTWVLVAIIGLLGVAAPASAAPVDPTWPLGPSYNYTADCTGATTVTDRWPDGSTGTITINGVDFAIPLNTTAFFPAPGGDYLFSVYFTVPDQVPMYG